MRLIVFGASGKCGSHVVRLASRKGHDVTAVVRETTTYEPPQGVRVVRGDVLAAGFVAAVMPAHDAVISCLGIRYAHPWARRESPDDFISRASMNIVSAMKEAGVPRVTVISAAGVGDSRESANMVIRLLIATSNVGVAYDDLARTEQVLRESGVEWQAVRPTTLTNRAGTGHVRRATGYPATARIPRADVAAFLLGEVERRQFSERTPMITGV